MSDPYLGYAPPGYAAPTSSIDLKGIVSAVLKELPGEKELDGERYLKVCREDAPIPGQPAGAFLESFDFEELRDESGDGEEPHRQSLEGGGQAARHLGSRDAVAARLGLGDGRLDHRNRLVPVVECAEPRRRRHRSCGRRTGR